MKQAGKFSANIIDRRISMNEFNTAVGYAFVPPQTTFNTFTPEQALVCGTLFPELSLTMCEYLRGVKEDKCNGK